MPQTVKLPLNVVGLVVPDVHEQIEKLKAILHQYEGVQWVVFLGDFMDSFDKLTPQTTEMVRWLAGNVHNPKYRFIWGNHDLHYAFPCDGTICCGYDIQKQRIVKSLLREEHWRQFKLHTWIGEPASDENRGNLVQPVQWLLSHGGLHPNFLHPIKGFDRAVLADMEEEAMWKLRYCQQVTAFIAAGKARGGIARVGGIDWLDWNREFLPISGLNQIVGHTFGKKVRKLATSTSINYCLDTHLKHVILVGDDGRIKVERVNV